MAYIADVEIYINQVVKFFDNNPDSLHQLIGDINKDDFYKKIREVSYDNLQNIGDYVLSKQQIIDIVVDLYKIRVKRCFEETPLGFISMN